MKKIINHILLIPNIPIILIIVLYHIFTTKEVDADNFAEFILESYPDWLFTIMGLLGWLWIILKLIL